MDERVDQMNQGVQGILIAGVFWYFDRDMSRRAITARAAKAKASQIVTGIFIVCAVILAAALAASAALLFALAPIVASALVINLCILYWRIQSQKNRAVMPKAETETLDSATTIPSLDIVERKRPIDPLFAPETSALLDDALMLAHKAGHSNVQPLHLFLASISTSAVQMLFVRLGIQFEQIKAPIRRKMATFERGETAFGAGAREITVSAFREAVARGSSRITPVELFYESYKRDDFLQELLFSLDVEAEEVENSVMWVRINESLRERYQQYRRAAGFKPTGAINRAYTSVATPLLDSLSEDLTSLGVRGYLPMLIGRDREMNALLRAMEGGGQSIVLVGPPGVGKEAIIAGIAERMIEERVPKMLHDKRLVKLSLPHIIGGQGAQDRLLATLSEVARSGNIILVIENIHELVQAQESGVDLSSTLASELEKGYTFVIATTTPEAYAQVVERSTIGTKFQKIDVAEPERNAAIQVLESKIGGIENQHKVVFTYESVAAIVELSMRYLHESYLPEKAVLLAKEVALHVAKGGEEWKRVTKEDVAAVISEKSSVPVTQVTREEGEQLLQLEERMRSRMVGQDEAVQAVASALRRARTELRSKNRPIANFLFLGPTGVGKTELAKTTAEIYFGNEETMLRFDMSEYQGADSVARMIGSAGAAGLLTEAVRKSPFALVLLDELEKAHPDILNLFLQVMDDGRLTDGMGRTIDFTNVILIATSNAGTQFIQDEVEKGTEVEEIKTYLMENQLKEVYRPEFLNRFDSIIVFKPLTREDVVAIAYLMMKGVAARLEAKGIHFKASDAAVHELAAAGYDPKFGARPLRRVIQERVDNAVAEVLLKGEVGRRDTLVLEEGGNIRVDRAAAL